MEMDRNDVDIIHKQTPLNKFVSILQKIDMKSGEVTVISNEDGYDDPSTIVGLVSGPL